MQNQQVIVTHIELLFNWITDGSSLNA